MKKTRIFALILAMIMAVAMFAGCGGNEESSEESSTEWSMPSVPASPSIPTATKWTAQLSDVAGWSAANIADNIFYANESVDTDSIAFLQFKETLTDGKTLQDVIQAYIDECNTNPYNNSQEWIIETPQPITFGGKESYEISYNLAVQTRAARHYNVIFTQLDDEVFIFNSNYTIRGEVRDEALIDDLKAAVTFVPMA